MKRTILFFCGRRNETGERKFSGICSYARKRHWNVRYIHYHDLPFDTYLKLWKPDGIITDNILYAPKPKSRIPTVFLDAEGAAGNRRNPCVVHDPRDAARLALAEFQRLGLKRLAFLPPRKPQQWSEERQDSFVCGAAALGIDVDVFRTRTEDPESPEFHRCLKDWTKRLPHPCGVLAANDETAEVFLALCPQSGIKVPSDLAVIGVDDFVQLCENTFPSLTSIIPAFVDSGRLAAERLDALLAGKPDAPGVISYGELGIDRRDSTKRLYGGGNEVREARDLIRREACNGLKARDVLKLMHGSRRGAEMHFKAEVGRTILEEIENVRLSKSKRLLANSDWTLAEIAAACGYASTSHLRKAFERRTRLTMGEWRKKHRKAGKESA